MNKYIGHESQIHSVEEHILVGGKGNGLRLLEIRNGKGLELTISLDRCMDISRLIYKGISLNYMNPVGYVHPSYYDKENTNFLKSFTAGFLTTCGLNNVGDPGEDNGEILPLHGNISNTPCSYYSYEIKEDKIVVIGKVSDEVIFSHKFVLNRKIEISLLDNSFTVEDKIDNVGDTKYPCLVLYHMNMGYPLLDETSELKINSSKIVGRTSKATKNIKTWNKILKPQSNYEEECFFHSFNKLPKISLYNKKINSGIEIIYDNKNLPYFTEWKMMGVRDYVLGLEPGNTYPGLRSEKRRNKTLIELKPNESLNYKFKINVFSK